MLKRSIQSLTSVPQFLFASKSAITVKLPKTKTHLLPAEVVPTETTTDREELLLMFKQMQTTRRIEIACDSLYKTGEIKGFCHLYDGQEAVIAGVERALTLDDCILTAYRCHGHAITRGDTPFRIMSEMIGKVTGSSRGKGGSMHLYNAKNNFYGGNAIVGAHIPLGAGLAFALKYLKKNNVAVCMYGDGAANQGQLFETINMAKLWNLPLCFYIENNHYAMGTSVCRSTQHQKYYARDQIVPGLQADGMNVFHTRETMRAAKEYMLSGKGPIFLEADTYRYHGHSMSDPGLSYRTREEVSDVRKQRDPISFLKNIMIESKACTQDEIEKIEANIKEEVDKAVKDARAAPYPNDQQMREDIYVNNDQYYIRHCEFDLSQFPNGKF